MLYDRRVVVELLALGHALQQRLAAAEPQQQVTLLSRLPIAQPIGIKLQNRNFQL